MPSRKGIREAIKLIVAPHVNTAFAYAPENIEDEDLPAATVSFTGGDREQEIDSKAVVRALVTVTIYAKAVGNIDAALDDIASPIELAVEADDTLGGLVVDCSKSSFEYSRDSEQPFGTLSLDFEVIYEE